MASMRDAQDMLGLPTQQASRPKPSKKGKKDSKKGPKGSQWNKELKSLMGERAPPLPLSSGPKWKDKRSRMMGQVRKWRNTPFKNDARTDGLILRHWQRLADEHIETADGVNAKSEEMDQKLLNNQAPYHFSKYNQKIRAPKFTPEEYADNLKSERWSEDETRYLMDLFDEFSGKWPIISDRYEYQSLPKSELNNEGSSGNDGSQQSLVKPLRRMEDLKSRFYDVSAKMMVLRIPASQMTETEYRDYEMMQKFNPNHELTRKKIKEQQMSRSAEERKEEQYLLSELKRIYANQERFDAELRELRGRVDHSLTDDKLGPNAYTTSAELHQLFQRIAVQDKNKAQVKMPQARRSLPDASLPGGNASSPTAATPTSAQHKKGTSDPSAAQTRSLTPRSEARFGVSTHERLTSGITFVSDKIAKARAATKSSQQNQKIAAILAEVGIPELMQMQTSAVCEEMEKLVEVVLGLLKTRQTVEKTENEVLVLRKQLEMDGILKPEEKKEEEEDVGNQPTDSGNADEQADVDAEGEPDSVADGETNEEQVIKTEDQGSIADSQSRPVSAAGRKRSASVLSTASASSRGGPRRKGARK